MPIESSFIVKSPRRRVAQLCAAVWLIGSGVGMSVAWAADAPSDARPSFACNTARTAIETEICSHPDLASRDRTMATLFAAARRDAFDRGASQQDTLQRQWLQSRDARCNGADMHACLVNRYDTRLWELAAAALFRAPEAALRELARQEPESARVYKAIYQYVTTQNHRQRTDSVASLIAPTFDALRRIPWEGPLTNIRSARDATSSDAHFAGFLMMASIEHDRLNLPCTAIVRRPALIQALDFAYGGALDGRLIPSDCSVMTPALPALDQLKDAAVKAQPACEGTIRFSLARAFAKTLVAVRLHRMDLLETDPSDIATTGQDKEAGTEIGKPSESEFTARYAANILQATNELAAYYGQYFNSAPAVAKAQAAQAVRAVVSGAYALCDRY